MSDFMLHNDVAVSIYGSFDGDAAPIVFDLKPQNTNHRNVSSEAKSIYQNITVEDAKRLRKELKAAIKGATGK